MWRSPRRLVQTGSAALWCRPKKCFRRDLIDNCHTYLDLGAELYDAVRRDAEELSRACCDAHEAGMRCSRHLDLPKPASEVACLDPICARDPGYVLGDDADQQNRPMQDLIGLEVVQQGR